MPALAAVNVKRFLSWQGDIKRDGCNSTFVHLQ
jgi:hypothetical protein